MAAQVIGTARSYGYTTTSFSLATPIPVVPIAVPNVTSATAIDSVTVDVLFDSTMEDNAELIDIDNYQIVKPNSTLLPVSLVVRQSATVVRLTCSEMIQGTAYELRACNMRDTLGNYIFVGPLKNQAAFTGIGTAPTVTLISPTNGATGVARGTNIVIDITDANSGVDISSVQVTVEGVVAFSNETFGLGIDPGTSSVVAIANGYRITLDPASSLAWGLVVNIVVTGADLAGNPIA